MFRHTLEIGLQEMGLSVSDQNIQAFQLFADELNKWNHTYNLTSIKKADEVAVKHIIDSLIFAGCTHDGERVLDIGSGAGMPAIPLKIVKPTVQVTSVDAVSKKILFQRHIARLLKLEGFEALHARVESLRKTHTGHFDVIVSRAFSHIEQFVVLAAPLLMECGRLVAMKGPAVAAELKDAEARLHKLGFEISNIVPYSLPLNHGERNLIIIIPRQVP